MAIKYFHSDIDVDGDVTADAHITNGGSASQFVKGDGTLDSSTYDNYNRWDLKVNGTHQLYITSDQAVDLVGTTPITATYSSGGVVTFTHSTASGYKHIPAGGSAEQWLKWSAAGTASWEDLSSIGTNSPFELVTSDAAATTAVENTNYTFSNSSGDFDFTLPTSPTDGAYWDVYLHDINTFNITNTIIGGEPTYADGMIFRAIFAGLGQYYVKALYDPSTGGSGTVTEVTSSTTNQLTVANGTTTPALSIVTSAVGSGGTALATGGQIYTFVTSQGYSTQTLTASEGTTLVSSDIQMNILNLTNATGTTNVGADTMVYYDLSQSRHVKQTFSEVHLSAFHNDVGWTTNAGIVESLTTTGTSGAATLSSGVLNIPVYAAANDATITLSAGSGLTTGGDFTTNQASNETITFNVGAGTGISVNANDVAVDTGTVLGWTRQQYFVAATETESTSGHTWDLSTEQVKLVTLTYNGTTSMANPTNQQAGGTYILLLKQGTNTTSISWGTAYKFPGGAAPSMTSTANAVDIITFVSDGTYMYGVAQKDFS